MNEIIIDPQYLLPILPPDGNYCPEENLGDLNSDQIINILDIIIIINYILNLEYISEADLNTDNSIDILDVILLVNIIIN